MDKDQQNKLYKKLGVDLRIISTLVVDIIDNRDIAEFVGKSVLNDLKRVETYIDTIRSKCENRYLTLNQSGDLNEFYDTYNTRLSPVLDKLRKENKNE